jgi:hypothetical protein
VHADRNAVSGYNSTTFIVTLIIPFHSVLGYERAEAITKIIMRIIMITMF